MIDAPTAMDVREYRDKHGTSIQKAHSILTRKALIQALVQAQGWTDVRDVLLHYLQKGC